MIDIIDEDRELARVNKGTLNWSIAKGFSMMQQITKDSIVEQVLTNFPKTLEIFIRHGFKDLSNPIMRNTMAKFVTIERACKMKAVDQETFLLELNQTINPSTH